MRVEIILTIIISLLGWSPWYVSSDAKVPKEILNEYKKFSLAQCIENNYEKMGVDFTKLPLKDHTAGFIDMDIGLAFYRDKDNVLASFIENKTGDFYKPKQTSGDLVSTNIVIYECIDFYHSRELDVFLRKIITERIIDDKNDYLE